MLWESKRNIKQMKLLTVGQHNFPELRDEAPFCPRAITCETYSQCGSRRSKIERAACPRVTRE